MSSGKLLENLSRELWVWQRSVTDGTSCTSCRLGLECEKDQVGVDLFQLGGAHATSRLSVRAYITYSSIFEISIFSICYYYYS